MENLPPGAWLPITFAVLMAVSMLLYAVLDGFDLGVGILLRATPDEATRDRMVASIGPFWDANETWLVLGVGLLLVARWARGALYVSWAGVLVVSAATPFASPRIFERSFALPQIFGLAPIPLATGALFLLLHIFLRRFPRVDHTLDWVPFAATAAIFVLCFQGLAYSFWPHVVPERLTIFEAAAAPESLMIILVGALAVLPMIGLYTFFIWRIFGGKARELTYH